MNRNKHWYRVTAFDESQDFFGTKRVQFDMHMDLNDGSDMRTAREVAGNMINRDTRMTYDQLMQQAIVMNFEQYR